MAGVLLVATAGLAVEITQVEPTPLFPKGEPLRQLVRLHLDHSGPALGAVVRVNAGEPQNIKVAAGKSVADILVPDIAAPAPVKIELLDAAGKVLATKQLDWQPAKKWTICSFSYCHQDCGYGDYPHRLRTTIRHENINASLRFCRETDEWPDADKYRYNMEVSEPLTSFIGFNGKDAAQELGRRIREGRIELGGLHSTVNSEELSHELMARLFYMTGRYAPDMLGVESGTSMQNTDVVGLTWPLAMYGAEADKKYFFHGFNGCGNCLQPAQTLPAFYWEGPDGQSRLLMRETPYPSGGAQDTPGALNEARVLQLINTVGKNWPYHVMLLQDGEDFQPAKRRVTDRIHEWNSRYAYPKLVSATLGQYFAALEKEALASGSIEKFAKDANNQWSDQSYSEARTAGSARRLSESLPATETLASLSQVLAGGNDQWMALFDSYHRLLTFYEHTHGSHFPFGNMLWFETERQEHKEKLTEANDYRRRAFENASRNLDRAITREGERNVVVFNASAHQRTDLVRAEIPAASVVDSATGATIPVQQLPDGTAVFVAENIPATGYKVFSLSGRPRAVEPAAPGVLESRFYRLQISATNGSIGSLFDKTLGVELVDAAAPEGFNEYLYQFFKGKITTDRMAAADAVKVEHGPVADVVTVTGKANGVQSLVQTIVLYHDLKRVDFGIWMDKSPFRCTAGTFPRTHEAVFVAMPFNVPNFTIHHELPGCVIEPYRQQFQGSCTAHYAIRSFTDFSNDKYGVTVSPVESGLVCYGSPNPSPIGYYGESYFNRNQTYPKDSRLYLYLLNNMFDVNISGDQRGPVEFHWSLTSHAGDWKEGKANEFGRDVQQPLLAWRADGRNHGGFPASASFMSVDARNVMCSVVKPAEANGRGFIIRLNETAGQETTTTVSLPMLPPIESVKETSLVENDRTAIAASGNTFKVTLPKFGVKTYRVTCAATPMDVTGLKAKAVADMQVDLSWSGAGVSQFNVYRDTNPDCPPTLLNFIGQSVAGHYSDFPRLNSGGWIRSALVPNTKYYYRIVPVDHFNNPGKPSAAVAVVALDSKRSNLPPVAVEAVRPLVVSPTGVDNYVNVLFRTSCESDIAGYEIYRSNKPGHTGALVGTVKSDDIPIRSYGYGEQWRHNKEVMFLPVKAYDHATFADKTVKPATTYYYKVRAVDSAGQKGAFSQEALVTTKDTLWECTAQSTRDMVTDAPQYREPDWGVPAGWKIDPKNPRGPGSVYGNDPVYNPAASMEGDYSSGKALDGDTTDYESWKSRPYGGGTKEKPLDVWWAVEFRKKPVSIAGVRVIGSSRKDMPVLKTFEIQIRGNGGWETVKSVTNTGMNDIRVEFGKIVTCAGLRIFVKSADLPKAEPPSPWDGTVTICEVTFLQSDGTEKRIE